jgi:ATP-dependent Clp protease ATP-binding subunit ClpC
MTYPELMRLADPFTPLARLERVLPWSVRLRARRALLWLVLLAVVLVALGAFAPQVAALAPLVGRAAQLNAFLLFVLPLALASHMLEAYAYSCLGRQSRVDYDAAVVLLSADRADLTASLLGARAARLALLRLGVSPEERDQFLAGARPKVAAVGWSAEAGPDGRLSLAELAAGVYVADAELRAFLDARAVTPAAWAEAFAWVSREATAAWEELAWWRAEHLDRVPSIGREWAFGQTWALERVGRPISSEAAYARAPEIEAAFKPSVDRVEAILAGEGKNAIVVAPESETALAIVAAVARRAARGDAVPEVEGKRFFSIDAAGLASTAGNLAAFERALRQGVAQAAAAGDTVVVLPALPAAIETARAIGADLAGTLAAAMSSTRVSVVACAARRGYHDTVETDRDLMRGFERVLVEEPDGSSLLRLVEGAAAAAEARGEGLVTVQAAIGAASALRRFLEDGAADDRARDLLSEAFSLARQDGRRILLPRDIDAAVSAMTGVPTGAVDDDERALLARLDATLAARVVGQPAATSAVAAAVRRARAGLAAEARPLATFLFLGPTGVGKTETAKALAEAYFGGEDRMVRLDMSEYAAEDGLAKLLGWDGHQGHLTSRLRERRGGLLLLDEFEKASPAVRALFLQVLDEGRFSDAAGEPVSARNFVIVATSNAGSRLFYDALSRGAEPPTKDDVVAAAVREGSFAPELMNRFDGVVAFSPLSPEARRGVAATLLRKTAAKLAEKGIHLRQDDALVAFVAGHGEDPAFGARAMRRAVDGAVEAAIAEAIVAGTLNPGDTAALAPDGAGGLRAERVNPTEKNEAQR